MVLMCEIRINWTLVRFVCWKIRLDKMMERDSGLKATKCGAIDWALLRKNEEGIWLAFPVMCKWVIHTIILANIAGTRQSDGSTAEALSVGVASTHAVGRLATWPCDHARTIRCQLSQHGLPLASPAASLETTAVIVIVSPPARHNQQRRKSSRADNPSLKMSYEQSTP